LELFFAVHRNPKTNMIASLSLVSRKKKAIVKWSTKMSDETSDYMTKPWNLHLGRILEDNSTYI
jgi:hypothetical protein